jgi:hypothetical protein
MVFTAVHLRSTFVRVLIATVHRLVGGSGDDVVGAELGRDAGRRAL